MNMTNSQIEELKQTVLTYIKDKLSDASSEKCFFEDYWPKGVEANEDTKVLAEVIMSQLFEVATMAAETYVDRMDITDYIPEEVEEGHEA